MDKNIAEIPFAELVSRVLASDVGSKPGFVSPTAPEGSVSERVRANASTLFSIGRPRRPLAPRGVIRGARNDVRIVSWEDWLAAYLPVAPSAAHILWHLRLAPPGEREELIASSRQALRRDAPIPREFLSAIGTMALDVAPVVRRRFLDLANEGREAITAKRHLANQLEAHRSCLGSVARSNLPDALKNRLADFADYIVIERAILEANKTIPQESPERCHYGLPKDIMTRLGRTLAAYRVAHLRGTNPVSRAGQGSAGTEKKSAAAGVNWTTHEDEGDSGVAVPPSPFTGAETPFLIPEWKPLGMDRMAPNVLARHILISGETGSGKTSSAIMPLLRSVVSYGRDGREVNTPSPAVVLVDPKAELVDGLEIFLKDRELDCEPLVKLQIGGQWRLDAFRDGPPHPEQIAGVLKAVAPPQRNGERRSSSSDFFDRNAANLVANLIKWEFGRFQDAGGNWSGVKAGWEAVAAAAKKRLDLGQLPDRILVAARSRELLKAIATVAATKENGRLVASSLTATADLPEDTFYCVAATVSALLEPLTAPTVRKHLWLDPFRRDPEAIDIDGALDEGRIITFSPPGGMITQEVEIVARGLKRAVYHLKTRERPVVFMADEAHRLINGSEEAEVIDRARAFRLCTVLATQQVAALRRAVGEDKDALKVLLNNLATKIVFRSSDDESLLMLGELIPPPPDARRRHILKVRAPGMLGVGEAYVSRADATWARGRVRLEEQADPDGAKLAA